MSTIEQKLQQLPDNLRATVKIIHGMYEKGASLRYGDIQAERAAAGMTEGSGTTVRKALELWRQIYEINFDRYDSPSQVEVLVKKTIESLRNQIKGSYEQEATAKIAAAEDSAGQARQELKNTKLILAQRTEKIEELQNDNTELHNKLAEAVNDITGLNKQNNSLLNEIGQLTVKLSASEERVMQAGKEKETAERNFEVLREEMELQRQSQLKVIDDWRQQYLTSQKFANDCREQLETFETANQLLSAALESEKQRHNGLQQDCQRYEREYLERTDKLLSEIAQLREQNAKLIEQIARMEGRNERVHSNKIELEEMLEQMKKFMLAAKEEPKQ